MDTIFEIPLSQHDLLNQNPEKFHVKQTYTADQIPKLLLSLKSNIVSADPFIIFKEFDSFFAVLDNAARVPTLSLYRSYDLIYHILDQLGHNLAPYLEGNDSNDTLRIKYLNTTKMIIYLLCSIIKMIDNAVYTDEVNKNRKKNDGDDSTTEWDKKRYKGLIQLYNVLQLPLANLWNPPIVEEPFTNLFCNLCYRTLEQHNPRMKQIGDTVFQILGVAVKRYNHAMTLPTKLLQILRTCEHAIYTVANGINILFEEFGITTIFNILVKEIIDELCVDGADTQTSKNFGIFLTELSVISPKIMISHLPAISDELLSNQSFTLRNSILKMMGDVLLSELTSEELSDELKQTRDDFLEKLFDHMMDVNSHVRSKVLNIFYVLKEGHAVPLSYQHKILELAVERLDDKSSLVRKNAVVLIKTFLERNPFAAKLTRNELNEKFVSETKKLEELHEKLIAIRKEQTTLDEKFDKEIEPEIVELIAKMKDNVYEIEEFTRIIDGSSNLGEKVKEYLTNEKLSDAIKLVQLIDIQAGNEDTVKELTLDLYVQLYKTHLKLYYIGDQDEKQLTERYLEQEKVTGFLEDSLKFSQKLKDSLTKLEEMLLSKTNSDVIEAINFFTTGYLFGIEGTEVGMIKVLNLVWSADKEKREAVTNAYQKIFFITDKQGRAHAVTVVINLSNFFEHLTRGYYIAFDILIKEWVESGDIDNQIIQVLFERFTLKIEHTTEGEARKSLQLLVLISRANNSIARANISILEQYGLTEFGLKDSRVYSATLSLLIHLVTEKGGLKYYKRYEPNYSLTIKVIENYKTLFFEKNIKNFDTVTAKAFDFIYHVSQTPDIVTEQILFDILKKLEESSDEYLSVDEKNNNDSELIKLPSYIICRLLYLIGYLAMKEMIFLDIDVYNNTKYRHDLNNSLKKKKNASVDNRKSVSSLLNSSSASLALKRHSGQHQPDQQNEDDPTTSTEADDRIAETINFICEKILLYSDDVVFKRFVGPIMDICKHPERYKDDHLSCAAIIAMLRFMFVSADFCETNMPILMAILRESKHKKIRMNILIGISDLMFRYPNIIGLWTKQIYGVLKDDDIEVRLMVVKILSHLIIQEMIRVKGQISDLALCIVDQNEKIRTTTQQLFKEIGTKPNTLYNVLPDIISRLGDMEINLEEEKYRTIMRFIFGLIEKNRQSESLVDKLCFRFKITKDERQWRDIVFCLAQISHTEKTIRKLIDHIPLYKDKVQIDEVYDGFKLIITNTSKLPKNELKEILTEFETKLDECLQIKENDTNNSESNPNGTSKEITQTVQKLNSKRSKNIKPQNRRSRQKKKIISSEEEGSSVDDSSDSDKSPPVKIAAKRKKVVDIEEASDEDDMIKNSKPQEKRRSRRR